MSLPGVTQWIKRWSTNQRVTGSIPSQGTGPQWGVCKRQPHINVSLPPFLSAFPST